MFSCPLTQELETKMKRNRMQRQVAKHDNLSKEAVHVFCRVKPQQAASSEPSCLRIVPPSQLHIIQTAAPNSNCPPKEFQCTFQRVFDESASQKKVFEEVALPQIGNLLSGRNSLLLTYGVTGSGKTYTMAGTMKDGGLMPRCFDVIFDSIVDCQAKRRVFKTNRLNGFDVQLEADDDAELELQTRITTARVHKMEKKNSDPDLAQRIRDEIVGLPIDTDNCFAVFITYVEIYNNIVYDLLEDIFDENTRVRPLQSRIVREDSNHVMFVHGVNEIEITSTDEAFEAYHYGQKRRRIAQTTLNAESSRSHSIFTIRLVQIPKHDMDKRNMVVSQLSLVDLAGSERTNRTKNTGMRLKEAGNINKSLLTLRTCLELLRENQNGANKAIPYRESRLTHLFKNYFDGDGLVTMVICVSPSAEEYEETMQVLTFAEMTQEITTTVQTPFPGKRKRALEVHVDNAFEGAREDRGDFKTLPIDFFESIPDIRSFEMTDSVMLPAIKNSLLTSLAQVESLRKSLDFHALTRNVIKFERDACVALSRSRALEQQTKAEKEKVAKAESKFAALEQEHFSLKRRLEESETAVKRLKTDLSTRDVLLKKKNVEQERVKEEYSNKITLAQEKLNREHERKMKTHRAAWENEMKHQEGRIRMARHVLASEMKPELPAYATPSRSRFPPSKSAESIPASVDCVAKSTTIKPSTASTKYNPSGVPGTPKPIPRKGVAVVNRRYRRSRSVDNEVWLEHRPIHEVPSNTLMQPVMQKRKSITRLTDARDVTEKTNKYCLLTQNQDSDGDLETRLYKGDVIPTSGGGAQVTFNDVEVLKQISPNISPSAKTPKQIRQDLEAACTQSTDGYRFRQKIRTRRPIE